MSNSSIWPIDRILSGAMILGHSGTERDDNEEVLCILQCSSIKLFSVIFRTLIREVLPSAEMQSVYSTALTNWVIFYFSV